ncbi:hypothetical protein [Donghicola sp.]|jgi:hypothetical protein|uniref:hypothetical protein n=1 Tax=Donghicola sp. TaxID=1929294 RepID=UPI0025E12E46|nr:hypothetical protein [Donghicola sp.]MCT4576612.1 hypothetical protein [Donghicola sp.]
MRVYGYVIAASGTVLCFFFSVIGIETAVGRVANLPGTLVGVGAMISGSVFAAIGELKTALDEREPKLARPTGSNFEARATKAAISSPQSVAVPEGLIKSFKGYRIVRKAGSIHVDGSDEIFGNVLLAEEWIRQQRRQQS